MRCLPAAVLVLVAGPSFADDKDGWTDLFNGKDFTGWVIDGPTEFKDKADGNKTKPLWSVKDGTIRSTGNGFGFLRFNQEYSDFLLHVEYRLVKEKGANSGIGIRTRVFDPKQSTATRPSFFSYEVQLLDDADQKPTAHTTGSLYRYVAPTKVAHKPAPEWNTIEIECVGPKIRVNCLSLGHVLTEGLRREVFGNDPERERKAFAAVPLRRPAQPEEVGDACIFLCTREGEYVNGATIPFDGGVA